LRLRDGAAGVRQKRVLGVVLQVEPPPCASHCSSWSAAPGCSRRRGLASSEGWCSQSSPRGIPPSGR
jgi:hypothetical protein